MKKITFRMLSFVLTCLSVVLGASSGVVMAAASALPDAGVTAGGDGEGAAGIATESQGRVDGDPEMYTKDIDERITKIR